MIIKTLIPLFCLLLLAPALPGAGEEEVQFQGANDTEKPAVKDRLMTSLFFRGELADGIIAAGLAGSLVDLNGIETYSGARAALLEWIRKNPEKAADMYFQLKEGRPVAAEGGPRTSGMRWEYNPKFIELVKALNATAKNSAVSNETLELAARRLYEGEQYGTETPAVAAGSGSGAGGGADIFSLNYADYRLNEAGLKREIGVAGAWLEAARGPAGRGPAGLEDLYGESVAQYGGFVAAASSVKGRKLITAAESRGLDRLRAGLRKSLAALSLGARSAELGSMAAALRSLGSEPGIETLTGAVLRLKAKLEAEADFASGRETALARTGAAVRNGEGEFAAMYLRYSAYLGLLDLKRAAGAAGFSCLYDYAVYRYLAAYFPGSAYPAARALLASSSVELGAALEKMAAGDAGAALASLGPRAGEIAEASRLARGAAAFNRGAQFFSGGFFFRPFEYKVTFENGRPAFRPAFTLSELLGAGKP